MTLAAGLHYGIEDRIYRDDPAPEPSLTASIAKILVGRDAKSPAHARLAHPRLNPNFEPGDDTKYDLGTIAHKLLLGRGRELEVLDYADWRTKDAREARQAAQEARRLAVLEKDYLRAEEIVGAVLGQLRERGYEEQWLGILGDPGEVVGIARSPDYPIWLRTMIDWLPDPLNPWDLKTSERSAAPDQVWRQMYDMDWPLQAAMHERVLNILRPQDAGKRAHRFVAVEIKPPYALTVVRLTEAHMTIGRAQLDRAEVIWATCMAAGKWPAYPLLDARPEYPAWAMKEEMDPNADAGAGENTP